MEMRAEALGLEPLFTIKELDTYLQVSTTTVYRLIKDGALTGTRIGQSLRFTRKNIEDLVELCVVCANQ
ncbi:helix-turn-helix domain-containing protein [Actinomyces sp. ICM47]|uniref:helix-turn-helix domain-containing protein n=1 Tax=Actinomyces sp. ICM47 TaxID=936548 RepID=UPI0025C6A973|nr:helix-turn-helix domain-containing protein [Actinomyces sp. ICM47]